MALSFPSPPPPPLHYDVSWHFLTSLSGNLTALWQPGPGHHLMLRLVSTNELMSNFRYLNNHVDCQKNKKTEIFYEVCLLCLTLQIKEKTVWWRQSKIQIWKMNQVIRCERFRQNVKTFAQLLVGGNCHIKIPHNCQSVLFQKSGKNIHKLKSSFKITP